METKLNKYSDGEQASSALIDASMDASSCAFRQIGNAAVMRRYGWLKSTTFRPEVQSRIMDMPFDGSNVFGKKVDDTLQSIKADTETARSLGVLQNKQYRNYKNQRQYNQGPFFRSYKHYGSDWQ